MTTPDSNDDIPQGQWEKLTRCLKQERRASHSAVGLGAISVMAVGLAGMLENPVTRKATYGIGFTALGAGIVTALGALACSKDAASIERDMYERKHGVKKSWVETTKREQELEDAHSR